MKLLLITTTIQFVCQAHHHHQTLYDRGDHNRVTELYKELEAHPPRCKNNEMICEDHENNYPRELMEYLLKYHHHHDVEDIEDFYTDYFDKRNRYLKWINQTWLPEVPESPCRNQWVEVHIPRVAHNLKNETVYIVQNEPYMVKKITYIKCLDEGGNGGCRQDKTFAMMMTLDQSGNMKADNIVLPFGCSYVMITNGSSDPEYTLNQNYI